MSERRQSRGRRSPGNEAATDLTEVWRVELRRGLRCLADGDVAAAEGHFLRAHSSGPDRPEVCFALGRERLRQGRIEEAEGLLRSAWDGGILAAAAALARCLAETDRRAEAHAVLDDACGGSDDEPGLLVVRAELHISDAQADQARDCVKRAKEILDVEEREAPATRAAIAAAEARIANLDGIALAGAGRNDEALFAFKRAFDMDPHWAGPLVNMGAVFARLGRQARARACYERALVLDGENAVARYNLAQLSRERGDAAAAEAEYRRVLELAPDYPGARVALADLLWASGGHAAAREVLLTERDLVVDAENVRAACRLAVALAAAGHVDEAARLERAARSVAPELAVELLDR